MNPSNAHNLELEALLDFYLAAGVDGVLADSPVDWYELTAIQARQRAEAGQGARNAAAPNRLAAPQRLLVPPSGPTAVTNKEAIPAAPVRPAPPASDGQTAMIPDAAVAQSAREAAAQAGSLAELEAILRRFEGCNLRLTAKNLVFADGTPGARIMLIGDVPGREEDEQGKPFVGRSGQLLDRMLKAVGLDRGSVYIANVVPWRPPGNRTPTPHETEICKPFIHRQIELANPEIVVFLGAAATKTLLGEQDSIRKVRGRWMHYDLGGRAVPCLATYDPEYLLKSPLEKRLSWRDFLSLRDKLTSLAQA